MSRGARSVSPTVAVHGLFVVFGLVIAAFFPFLAIYLNARGVDASRIGLLITIMAIARVVFLPVWGHLSDTRLGRTSALRIGTIGTAIFAALMNVVRGFWGLAAISFLVSVFMVAIGPNVDAIALIHLGDERMSDYGRIRGWESVSYAAGCLLLGAVLQSIGVRWAMPAFSVMVLSVLAWSSTIASDRPSEIAEHGRLGAVGAVFKEAPRFWGFLAAVLLLWTGFNAAWNFFSLKIEQAGGGPLLVGLGTALGGVAEVAVMRLSVKLHKRYGLRLVYVAGCCVYAIGFLSWGLVSSPRLVATFTVFEGTAFALIFTTAVVIVGRLVPPRLYSTGNSIAAMVAFGIGPIIGAGAGGFVFQYLGAGVLFGGAAILALSAGAVAWFALAIPRLSEPGSANASPIA